MKNHDNWCSLNVLLLTLLFMAPSWGQTLTMTAPANGSTLTCAVQVQVTASDGTGLTWHGRSNVRLVATFQNGTSTTTDMTPIATDLFQASWNTLQVDNGNYTLQAFRDYIRGGTGYPPGPPTVVKVATALINVTVRNGFVVAADTNKTFAKVESPTQGQKVGFNSNFSLRTNHAITFTRYETCS
jgi:hypothetical protein